MEGGWAVQITVCSLVDTFLQTRLTSDRGNFPFATTPAENFFTFNADIYQPYLMAIGQNETSNSVLPPPPPRSSPAVETPVSATRPVSRHCRRLHRNIISVQ